MSWFLLLIVLTYADGWSKTPSPDVSVIYFSSKEDCRYVSDVVAKIGSKAVVANYCVRAAP